MQLGHNMARLRPSDLEDLTVASTKLAEIAAVIGAVKSPWAATAIQQVRDVNDIVLRIRDRGLERMRVVLGKIGDRLDQEARAKAAIYKEPEDEE